MTDDERRQRLAMSRRLLAERSLHEFARQAWHVLEPSIPFSDGWHIKAICNHLEAVSRGEIPQLLINVPPGTMKSYLVCVFWIAWIWIKHPDKRFLVSSYAAQLSERDSVRTRDLILSEWYQQRWPIELRQDRNTVGKFENHRTGWRMVGSVEGKGIGDHPDFNIADDPHNVLQAESEADRATVTHWFEGVFCVRGVVRDVKRVLVMQRLHALDCSGVALDKGGWTHLRLPMRYEPPRPMKEGGEPVPYMPTTALGFQDPRKIEGELLWPAVYTELKVANLEVNLGLYGTAGQLQQNPSPRGGGKFKREWFRVVNALPNVFEWVRYWDKAGSSKGTGARSASCLMGKFRDDAAVVDAQKVKYVIADADAFRKEAAEREAVIKQKAATDLATYGHVRVWVEQEPGSGGKESAQGTKANLDGHSVEADKVTGSKEVRCDPLATAASVGKVWVLAGPSTEKLLQELEAFPTGALKDMVDAAGGAYNKLAEPTGAFTGSQDFKAGHTAAANEAVRREQASPVFFQKSPSWFLPRDQM